MKKADDGLTKHQRYYRKHRQDRIDQTVRWRNANPGKYIAQQVRHNTRRKLA